MTALGGVETQRPASVKFGRILMLRLSEEVGMVYQPTVPKNEAVAVLHRAGFPR
jgi:hypothetical protein